jgi:hypothetical protein
LFFFFFFFFFFLSLYNYNSPSFYLCFSSKKNPHPFPFPQYEDFEPPYADAPAAQSDAPLGATHPHDLGAASIDDAPSELLTPKRTTSSQGSAEPFRLVDMYGSGPSSERSAGSPGELSGEWGAGLATLTLSSARRRGEL